MSLEQRHIPNQPETTTAGFAANALPCHDAVIGQDVGAETSAIRNILDDPSQAAIENYLDQVFAPLASAMPDVERQERRAELREHLHSLIAAHEELGATRSQATALTLKQSGTAQIILRQWRDQCALPSLRASQRLALRCFGGTSLVSFLLLCATRDMVNYTAGLGVVAITALWLPLISGCIVGFRSQVRPVRATLRAIAVYALPMLLLARIWAGLQTFHSPWDAASLLSVVQIAGWTMFGTVGAGVCALLKRLEQRISTAA